jgi:hypothetical protein
MDPYMSGMTVGPMMTSGCDTCGSGAVITGPAPAQVVLPGPTE